MVVCERFVADGKLLRDESLSSPLKKKALCWLKLLDIRAPADLEAAKLHAGRWCTDSLSETASSERVLRVVPGPRYNGVV